MTIVRISILTVVALIAFASNSLLCRVALGRDAIDPASFTGFRIASGALALLLLQGLASRRTASIPGDSGRTRGGWRSGFLLFAYAVAFSFAYVTLTAATGALILFASVQATIIVATIASGGRLRAAEWTGLALALGGLVYLTLPGLAAPPPGGCALMLLAGIAWGLYTLRGRGSAAPLRDTARNFAWAVAPSVVTVAIAAGGLHVTRAGVVFATASGILASGAGYVVWYAALRGLSATQAAMVQLAVPVLAAAGAVVFLSETIGLRLVISALLILCGIGLALVRRRR